MPAALKSPHWFGGFWKRRATAAKIMIAARLGPPRHLPLPAHTLCTRVFKAEGVDPGPGCGTSNCSSLTQTFTQMSFPQVTVAEFLSQHLELCSRTQREVALACGYRNPNIITMFKKGATKVPMDVAPALAVAIGVEPLAFVRLAMQQYLPATWATIESVLEHPHPVTKAEAALLQAVRDAAGGRPINMTCTSNLLSLRDAVRECIAREEALACIALRSVRTPGS
jgi:hypothetical protein